MKPLLPVGMLVRYVSPPVSYPVLCAPSRMRLLGRVGRITVSFDLLQASHIMCVYHPEAFVYRVDFGAPLGAYPCCDQQIEPLD